MASMNDWLICLLSSICQGSQVVSNLPYLFDYQYTMSLSLNYNAEDLSPTAWEKSFLAKTYMQRSVTHVSIQLWFSKSKVTSVCENVLAISMFLWYDIISFIVRCISVITIKMIHQIAASNGLHLVILKKGRLNYFFNHNTFYPIYLL